MCDNTYYGNQEKSQNFKNFFLFLSFTKNAIFLLLHICIIEHKYINKPLKNQTKMENTHKICKCCKEAKPVSEFNKRSLSKDGLQYNCRPCNSKTSLQFRKTNPNYKKEWDLKNPGRQNEIVKNWVSNNYDKFYATLLKTHDSWGSGIYRVFNRITGEAYIGASVHMRGRKYAHFTTLNFNCSNRRLQESMAKYGKNNFEFQILEKISDLSILADREKHWIELMKPAYNINLV